MLLVLPSMLYMGDHKFSQVVLYAFLKKINKYKSADILNNMFAWCL